MSESKPKIEGSGASGAPTGSGARASRRERQKGRYRPGVAAPSVVKSGKCADLKDHVFDCSESRSPDQYNRTLQEIVEYVGREYTGGADLSQVIEEGQLIDIPKPKAAAVDSAGNVVDPIEAKIVDKQIDAWVKRSAQLEQNMRKALVADYFSKPLQGTLFRKFRVAIQGLPVDHPKYGLGPQSDMTSDTAATANPRPQECVGQPGIVTGLSAVQSHVTWGPGPKHIMGMTSRSGDGGAGSPCGTNNTVHGSVGARHARRATILSSLGDYQGGRALASVFVRA
jgi:hypothetical protein